jgi:hypothetical protein
VCSVPFIFHDEIQKEKDDNLMPDNFLFFAQQVFFDLMPINKFWRKFGMNFKFFRFLAFSVLADFLFCLQHIQID